jgi:hypothetical protein
LDRHHTRHLPRRCALSNPGRAGPVMIAESEATGRCHPAAPLLARLIAHGLPGRAEAAAALLHATAVLAGPVAGRRSATPGHSPVPPIQIRRSEAARNVRNALVPLLEIRAPLPVLLTAAQNAAPSLTQLEISQITSEAIGVRLRRTRQNPPHVALKGYRP